MVAATGYLQRFRIAKLLRLGFATAAPRGEVAATSTFPLSPFPLRR